jgi:hypothetical protein
MYEKLIKSSQGEFSLLNGVNNSRDLMIGLNEKYNCYEL